MKKTIHMQSYRRAIEELRKARLRRNLRQEDAGRLLGVSRQWVQKAESAEIRLDLVQFVRLCRLYRVAAGRLLRRLEEELSDEDDSSFYLSHTAWKGAAGDAASAPALLTQGRRCCFRRPMYAWISVMAIRDALPIFSGAGSSPAATRRYTALTESPSVCAASPIVTSRSADMGSCATSISSFIMTPF